MVMSLLQEETRVIVEKLRYLPVSQTENTLLTGEIISRQLYIAGIESQ
jgi:hypothetical protein